MAKESLILQQMPKAVLPLEVKSLSYAYEAESMAGLTLGIAKQVLQDVDFVVKREEIRVILGASGSGKTTLLKNLIGLLRPSHGQVYLFGRDIFSLAEDKRVILMRRMGVLFQNSALLNSLTVAENVALPLLEDTHLAKDIVEDIVHLKLSLVGLAHAAFLMPKQLSGGMLKRAALARALVLDPEILICDEPSAGLDPITSAELDDLLLALRAQFKMTMVVVTHELASIRAIADKILLLKNGRVFLDDTLEALENSTDEMVQTFLARKKRGESNISLEKSIFAYAHKQEGA